ATSIALHASFLLWLLHAPSPVFVKPSGVRSGERGTSLSPIYLARSGQRDRDGQFSLRRPSSLPADRSMAQLRTPRPSDKNPIAHKVVASTVEQEAAGSQKNEGQKATIAGSPLGSLVEGSIVGQEVRPALPIFGPQPHVSPSELPQGMAGDVVAEVTI